MSHTEKAESENHYLYHATGRINKEQKKYLIAIAKEKISDRHAQNTTIKWILSRQMSVRKAEQLCKRWGVELIFGTGER